MKHSILIFLAFLPISLLAQNKCDYEYDKVDDFTKERSVCSEFSRIYIQGKGKHTAAAILSYAAPGSGINGNSARKEELFFSACNIGGKNLLCMKVRSTDGLSAFFDQKYMVLLENGAIVYLWRIDVGKSGNAVSFTSDAGWSSYLLGVDKKGWENLKASGVKKIRMPEDKYNYRDIEIDEKNADAIQQGIACIEALKINNVTYEKDNTTNEGQASKPSSHENAKGEAIPSTLLNKKWHSQFTTSAGNKDIEIESVVEYFNNNELIAQSTSTIDGKKHESTSKGKFEIANNGKYIIYYYDKIAPQTYEIVSLEENVFITKSLTDNKVHVCNKL